MIIERNFDDVCTVLEGIVVHSMGLRPIKAEFIL